MRISLFGDNSDQLRVGTVGRIYQKKKRKEITKMSWCWKASKSQILLYDRNGILNMVPPNKEMG
jgi:hypothetical protein